MNSMTCRCNKLRRAMSGSCETNKQAVYMHTRFAHTMLVARVPVGQVCAKPTNLPMYGLFSKSWNVDGFNT
jgi:hypothetical protein